MFCEHRRNTHRGRGLSLLPCCALRCAALPATVTVIGALNGAEHRTSHYRRTRPEAADVSIDTMRPLATLLVTTTACATPATGISAAYRAPPVTLSRPSTRSIGAPSTGQIDRSLSCRDLRQCALQMCDARASP